MKLAEVQKINPNGIIIHSGIIFDVFDPKIEDIKITDIAYGLSNICRYGGHSPKFYSVAQHSVLCSLKPGSPQEQFDLLLHDGSEGLGLFDLPTPIKRQMPEYKRIEDNLMKLIAEKFNLSFPLTEKTHEVDKKLLEFEYKNFFEKPNTKFVFWSPKKSEKKFLERYYKLKKQINSKKMK